MYIDSTCVDKHLIGWSGDQCSRYFNAFGSTFENNEKFCVKGHHEQKWWNNYISNHHFYESQYSWSFFGTLLIVITLVYIWQFHESRRSMIKEFKSQTLLLNWHCLFAGLQMFHNLIKQFRKQWIRIPILRKLLKASHHVIYLMTYIYTHI